ncbi:putative glutamine-dependent NAD(+) synthetase [Cyphellophora attinorum]|uniref:Putative glutamine-dependent NAD(+) synthetase n=1 Tax=Cyphellophora attinorum TaxID=1664694 RepID=A0A0N1P026_9EURO|nr:putative glutamine-dependent NAD(+) synthetase [Phialophora attinorum]KPI42007.1 putative glutamine-dependent NAD(+) synthetase [Phialophora attinorum]
MGMTYAELSIFGRLRKVHKLGVWGMYERLVHLWGQPAPVDTHTTATEPDPSSSTPPEPAPPNPNKIEGRGLSARAVYEKVRRFYYYFNVNRHKATILPPGLHLEEYSPEDNRYDLRPFLYPPMAGSWPIEKIEAHVQALEERERKREKEGEKKGEDEPEAAPAVRA